MIAGFLFFSFLIFFCEKYIVQRLFSWAKKNLGFFLVKIILSKFISDSDFNDEDHCVQKITAGSELDSAPLHRCHRPYPNLFLRFRDLLILCLFYFDVTLDSSICWLFFLPHQMSLTLTDRAKIIKNSAIESIKDC